MTCWSHLMHVVVTHRRGVQACRRVRCGIARGSSRRRFVRREVRLRPPRARGCRPRGCPRRGSSRSRNAGAEHEEHHEGDDRRPVGAGQLEHEAEQEGAEPGGATLAGVVEGEVLTLPAPGDEQAEERSRQRLGAAQHDRDGDAERQEQRDVALRQEHREDDDHHPRVGAPQDRPVGPEPGREPPERQRAAVRHELDEQDRGDQHRLPEAELLRAVRRRDGDHRLDAVVVEEERDEERQRHRVAPHLLERRPELAEAALHQGARGGHQVARRVVAEADDRDDREPGPPQRRRQQREPHGATPATGRGSRGRGTSRG